MAVATAPRPVVRRVTMVVVGRRSSQTSERVGARAVALLASRAHSTHQSTSAGAASIPSIWRVTHGYRNQFDQAF